MNDKDDVNPIGASARTAASASEQPPAPSARYVSKLQKQFDSLVEEKPNPASRGFFGGVPNRKSEADEALITHVTQTILREAMASRSSDIHLEPMGSHLRVRFRIDGILEEVLTIPNALNLFLVSHIRVMCGLDPEKGGIARPQDARMAVTVEGQEADVRLSTFPTPHGDKAVLRLLPRNVKPPGIEELGLRPVHVEILRQLIKRPQGMIIITGPTSSGKSTTLYTMLQALNAVSRNIVTLEDPIEMKIPGVTQGAIQSQIGFNFADGLRAILRQDPNVIMVGEARDGETAEIALKAALTGHLIFTTLHTNNALGAIARLLDMGIEPFLITSAVTAVCAQRLARRVCDKCRETYRPGEDELALLGAVAQRIGVAVEPGFFKELSRGKGCESCRYTGFKGRILLFETAHVTKEMKALILRKAGLDEMTKEAVGGGMETLLYDGLQKVNSGETTLDEVIRVAGAGN
ncbi:MAG TPA: type II secretion system protein GspE [Elusimicrobia bacterium]|nr:type II secretion system protein GspE [Elusimicrobiota bacterium]HBT62997.1 type II secretion system protein GspE [Elusimicrobiota bacterium]